jgi:hypothetical protein
MKRTLILTVVAVLIVSVNTVATRRTVDVIVNDHNLQIDIPAELSAEPGFLAHGWVARRVSKAIMEQMVERLYLEGIEPVVEEAIELYWREVFGDEAKRVERFEFSHSAQKKLAQALKSVVYEKRNASEVYLDVFRDEMTEEDWAIWVKEFGSAEKIAKLEALIPKSERELFEQSKSGIRLDILQWIALRKLAIEKGLEISEARFAEAAERMGENISRIDIRVEHRLKALHNYWPEHVGQLVVKLPDEFADAVPLIKRFGIPTLPKSVINLLEEKIADKDIVRDRWDR